MTRSSFEGLSVVDFANSGERVHLTAPEEFEDLIFSGSRACRVLVERYGDLIKPPMREFGTCLVARAGMYSNVSDDICGTLRRKQLEQLYAKICLNYQVHALAGMSADTETMCVLFTDPSMLECYVRLQTGNVPRLIMP